MTAPLERLLGLARWERAGMRLGLERIEALLDALGHPEAALRIVHVGGTNGKGSVAALTAAILRAAGLRTGLYTSPHLLDVTERVRIDGLAVPREVLARHAARIGPALETGAATFFEAMTAVALAAFREAGVEAAVLEVGLGGPVGRDERGPAARVGGDADRLRPPGVPRRRLEDIAGEKAGIIRGGTALSAAQAPEAMAVIEARCRAVGVPLLVEGRELAVETLASDLAGHRLASGARASPTTTSGSRCPGSSSPATPCWRSARSGRSRPRRAWRSPRPPCGPGCAGVRWPGRFQVIAGAAGRPTLVLDGAHNPAGAAALAASLGHHFAGRRLALVLGVSADKDRVGILKALAPLASRIYLAPADHPRATPPKELLDQLPPVEADVVLTTGSEEALERALGEPGIDVVCVAGSLFLVADALRWLGARGLVDAV